MRSFHLTVFLFIASWNFLPDERIAPFALPFISLAWPRKTGQLPLLQFKFDAEQTEQLTAHKVETKLRSLDGWFCCMCRQHIYCSIMIMFPTRYIFILEGPVCKSLAEFMNFKLNLNILPMNTLGFPTLRAILLHAVYLKIYMKQSSSLASSGEGVRRSDGYTSNVTTWCCSFFLNISTCQIPNF